MGVWVGVWVFGWVSGCVGVCAGQTLNSERCVQAAQQMQGIVEDALTAPDHVGSPCQT